MSRSSASCTSPKSPAADVVHERTVEAVNDGVDGHVLCFEPVDDRREPGVRATQVREDRRVLQPVMLADERAVAGTVGAERPLVLPHDHVVEQCSDPARSLIAVAHPLEQITKLR